MKEKEKNFSIHKVIIPAAGLGVRFLPLSKAISKPLLPLVDEPMIAYGVREAKESLFNEVIIVLSEKTKEIFSYFKTDKALKDILEKRNQKEILEKLFSYETLFENIKIDAVYQNQPIGDGDAVLRARRYIGEEPCAVLFPDDIFVSQKPVLAQLVKIFQSSRQPIIGLHKVPAEKFFSYGIVKTEKIAHRLYKIKSIVEKPKEHFDNLIIGEGVKEGLAICGRYILTPEVFSYLSKASLNEKGELILVQAFNDMLADGKIIYGYEIEGDWLECGRTIDWLKSNIFLVLQHREYGPLLKEWLKKTKPF